MRTREPVDVCIVGSGAAGSVAARELAEAGLRVVVLEAGGVADPSRIPTARPDWESHSGDFTPSDPRIDHVSLAPDSADFRLARYMGVGGSTMHYEGCSLRMHPADWQFASRHGVGSDWPLDDSGLTREYDRVERFLQLSGANDNPFDVPRGDYPMPAVPMSRAVQTLARGASRVGLHPVHAPLAVLTQPTGGRGACNHCGACWSGCAVGAISNASMTYIPAALRAGATLQSNCIASRLVLDRRGTRVEGIEYLDGANDCWYQRARGIVLCGNAVETARLLLLSAQRGFPDGLANSSGLVGRGFMGHTTVRAEGRMDQRVDGYKGPNINGLVHDFCRSDERRGFLGGYLVALRNAEGGPLAFYRSNLRGQGLFGAALYRRFEADFGHSLNALAFGEQLADEENRVTLDPAVTDGVGLPVARIRNVLSPNDRAMQQHATRTLTSMLEAAGASGIRVVSAPAIAGTHLMGTARMGTDPTRSVCDPFGMSHDLPNLFVADGSLFPSASALNPTLTIQALATRVAEHIVGAMRAGKL